MFKESDTRSRDTGKVDVATFTLHMETLICMNDIIYTQDNVNKSKPVFTEVRKNVESRLKL